MNAHDSQQARNLFSPSLLPWLFLLITLLGLVLRLFFATPQYAGGGADESTYANYAVILDQVSLQYYPEIFDRYLANARQREGALLPPSRLGLMVPAYTLMGYGLDALTALRLTSRGAAMISLLFAVGFLWRAAPDIRGLAALALFATMPTQLYAAQYAVVDGVLAMWTIALLWMLFEHWRDETRRCWPILFALAAAGAVLTKENAFFVYAALSLLIWGRAIRQKRLPAGWLIGCWVLGPSVGMGLLWLAAGGPVTFFEAILLFMEKNTTFTYTEQYMDGPYYRYWVDLTLVHPLLMILVAGAFFTQDFRKPLFALAGGFLLLTFLQMASLPNGQSLRFASIWDFSLAVLAGWMLVWLAEQWFRGRRVAAAILIAIVAASGVAQFHRLFIAGEVYEPVSHELMLRLEMGPVVPKNGTQLDSE